MLLVGGWLCWVPLLELALASMTKAGQLNHQEGDYEEIYGDQPLLNIGFARLPLSKQTGIDIKVPIDKMEERHLIDDAEATWK